MSASFVTTNTCAVDGDNAVFGPSFHIEVNILMKLMKESKIGEDVKV